MKLYEYEGKELFKSMGIPIPEGGTVRTADAARSLADKIGYPVAIKAQLLRGGRGKAGAVRFAENSSEAIETARDLLELKLGEERVETLLVEKKLAIDRELYTGITFDHATRGPLLLCSSQGGVDVERIAANRDNPLQEMPLDPFYPTPLHEVLRACKLAGITGAALRPAAEIIMKLISGYFHYDAITAEINPLIVSEEGRLYAADAKFEMDDSAAFRQQWPISRSTGPGKFDPYEAEAAQLGLAYVRLESGNIGVISGGAGLCMASMDIIAAAGGRPANFLDLGGGASREKTAAALRMVLKTPGVQGVLMNVFGGINNCEVMANGVADLVQSESPKVPIVVKMRGHSQDEGWQILEGVHVPIVKFGTTEEAVSLLMEAVCRRK